MAPLPLTGWLGGEEEAALWISDQIAIFPDWASIWDNLVEQRETRRIFEQLTPEVRRNRKIFNGEIHRDRSHYPSQSPEHKRRYASKYFRERRKRDPGFRIACNLRNRFKEIMDIARDPSKKWNSSLIGCDTRQLAAHLESQFKRGMSWENYGTNWHVDHIMPCSAFDHTNPDHVRRCWHFTNLRPMAAKENLAKGAQITQPQLALAI
jgi:hypothetical protein